MTTKQRQYIGARYVIKVYENSENIESAEWESDTTYEPLVLVTYQNGSYLSKKDVPSTVGNPATNPIYWVQTGFYNGQIANLQHQIDAINDALDEYDGDIEDIENAIKSVILNTKNLNANLILNHNYAASQGLVNGSCYVGNDRVVTYFSARNSNTGILRCYNISTYSIMWEYAIKGYHGNSITYNPNNNHIYICGCLDNTNNNRLNIIVEIDLDAPSSIIREINLPSVTECYSLVFDTSVNKFYAIAYVGTTAGTSDMLYIFNENLTAMETSVQLENYPAVAYGLSTQGVQLGLNGIAYILAYETNGMGIYGYDTSTGKCVTIAPIPSIVNKCRMVGELQSIVYDPLTSRTYVGSQLWYPGVDGYYTFNLFEIDLFKGISVVDPVPSNEFLGMTDSIRLRMFGVILAGDNLRPSWWISKELISVPNDALIYSRVTGKPIDLFIMRTSSGITGQGTKLWNLAIEGFKGVIEGYDDTDRIAVKEFRAKNNCDIVMRRLLFEGYEATDLASGYYCNAYLANLARILFQSCTFDEYTASGDNKYHILSYLASTAYTVGCTFNGTVDNNSKTGSAGTVVTA